MRSRGFRIARSLAGHRPLPSTWLGLSPSTPKAASTAGLADVAFASRRDGNWEIYRMDATGQKTHRVGHCSEVDARVVSGPGRLTNAHAVGVLAPLSFDTFTKRGKWHAATRTAHP